jgi:hypothetical protein
MWKKLVALAVGIFMMVTPVMADELGVGGAYVTGHSRDSNYAVNNDGWGIAAHYDKDMGWQKRFSENNAIGIDPGMAYFYLRWQKDTETKETKYEKYDREWYFHEIFATTTKTSKRENINSHILAATLKPYWELYKNFRMFGVGGAGYEFADDENNAPAVLAGAGIQYMFTKDFGTSLGHYRIWSDPTDDYRRFDATVLSVDLRF